MISLRSTIAIILDNIDFLVEELNFRKRYTKLYSTIFIKKYQFIYAQHN